MTIRTYRGRFAPSPTGPLHFGSLVTALASYLEARVHQGVWLIRIEDLDPLRESTDAVDCIRHSLDVHGLVSDEPVRYQSEHHDAYHKIIQYLLDTGVAYRCTCSRKMLRAHNGRHPNRCREHVFVSDGAPHSVRFALWDETTAWRDDLLGNQTQAVSAELDDPVILRKEGFFAYQLAVVVDDIDQGITDVVRGSDLLDMTAQQQQIYQTLGASPPRWLHIPVILDADGQKLSKQTHAPALDDSQPGHNLWRALAALGQRPPEAMGEAPPAAILDWAITHWRRDLIPRQARMA